MEDSTRASADCRESSSARRSADATAGGVLATSWTDARDVVARTMRERRARTTIDGRGIPILGKRALTVE